MSNKEYSAVINSETTHREYHLPQPSGLVRVAEYLLTNVDNRRCCLLRWKKETDIHIDSITFDLTQLDASGRVIDTHRYTQDGALIPQVEKDATFTPGRAMPVESNCVAVRVRVCRVASGSYVYNVIQNRVQVDYLFTPAAISQTLTKKQKRKEKRRRKKEEKKRRSLEKKNQIHSKLPLRTGRLTFWAVIAVLLVVVVMLRSLIPYDEIREFITEGVESIVDAIGNAIDDLIYSLTSQ